jgi:O-antigen/teichoic acid export membrane protein
MIVPVACLFLNLLVFFVAARTIETHFGIPELWVKMLPLLVMLQVIPYIVSLLYQVKEHAAAYGKYQVALTAFNLGFAVLFVAGFRWGWEGRLLGMYLAYLLFSLIGISILVRGGYWVRCIDKHYIKAALVIGVPLIPHELSLLIINASDRLFISKMVGLEATGFYSIGYQVGMVVLMVCSSFNQAWAPYLFRQLHDCQEKKRRSLVRKTYFVAGVYLLIIPFFFLAIPIIYRFFINESFVSSMPFVYWTAISYLFYGFYMLAVNYIYFVKKTHLLTGLTIGNALLNLLLNYLLISYFGAIGAAYATTASFLIFFILAWWLSNKVYPMPWFYLLRGKGFGSVNL